MKKVVSILNWKHFGLIFITYVIVSICLDSFWQIDEKRADLSTLSYWLKLTIDSLIYALIFTLLFRPAKK